MKKSPNPTPRSPVAISKDQDYEVMTDYQSNQYWPSASEIIVKHKKSKTFWQAVYSVRMDDSDAEFGATWHQVISKKITTIRYETKK